MLFKRIQISSKKKKKKKNSYEPNVLSIKKKSGRDKKEDKIEKWSNFIAGRDTKLSL